MCGRSGIFELRIQRVHLDYSILLDGNPNRIDPGKWRPLILSFAQNYELREERLGESTLAQVPERLYRSPDVDTARKVSLAR